ncbi:hypothetical protein KDA_35350 [Dictyobacter alpinus]|uniref:PPM-type phosphatase domain-containing protein n=1 Tax=Dictyobacter alpinus TaxID=2014873 RepID=A0A402B9J7_9CHLR|nr:protein phosphatase 2C domain-containing protein [Dictyobacter alpinus]GCE28051.1 hypothetical protein KDA_35350 [Dictyobacter alpinus]
MPPENAANMFRVLETDQVIDSFTRTMLGSSINARVLSFRCREAQEQSLPNQDYATVSYCKDGSSLIFCICDGVGSSYKGDFAACCLASYLVKWLQALPARQERPTRLDAALQEQLDRLAPVAQGQLIKLEMPDDTPALVREVLEDLCRDYGSEAVFLCGRLDYEMSVDGRPGQLSDALFCWMGNVTARLFLDSQQSISLGEKTDKNGRWSTRRGCRGELHTWSRSLPALERLVIHTDGLDEIGTSLATLDDDALLAEIQHLLTLPKSDDMTLLDLYWQDDVYEAEVNWR